jgi:hypothetical protein
VSAITAPLPGPAGSPPVAWFVNPTLVNPLVNPTLVNPTLVNPLVISPVVPIKS